MVLVDWTQEELAKRSGVAQRTVSGILNLQGDARVDTVDRLAQACGLRGWHLIMDDLPNDIEQCRSIAKMIENYLASDGAAQDYINHIAEREGTYKKK